MRGLDLDRIVDMAKASNQQYKDRRGESAGSAAHRLYGQMDKGIFTFDELSIEAKHTLFTSNILKMAKRIKELEKEVDSLNQPKVEM